MLPVLQASRPQPWDLPAHPGLLADAIFGGSLARLTSTGDYKDYRRSSTPSDGLGHSSGSLHQSGSLHPSSSRRGSSVHESSLEQTGSVQPESSAQPEPLPEDILLSGDDHTAQVRPPMLRMVTYCEHALSLVCLCRGRRWTRPRRCGRM